MEAGLLLHAALEVEEGGGLQEEEGEGAGSGVRQRVALRPGRESGREAAVWRKAARRDSKTLWFRKEAALCQRHPVGENHTSGKTPK